MASSPLMFAINVEAREKLQSTSEINNFAPSHYQRAIFDWIINDKGNAVVQAAAGSGKTTTLVEAAKLLPSKSATFVAFNKHITQELQKRLGKKIVCKTIHSIGMSALRSHLGRAVLDDNKYVDIAKPYAREIAEGLASRYESELREWNKSHNKEELPKPELPPNAGLILGQFKKLAHFCMVTLTDPKDFCQLEEMIDCFNCLDDSLSLSLLYNPLVNILDVGEQLASNQAIITYDDMLWLPWKWHLTPPLQDYVFVDECQDLSAAQLDLVLKMRKKRGGRILFVGDKNQAIMGFAGALSDSVDQIIKHTKAKVLPLSICYRCPKNHVKLAQKIVPSIEPAPNKEDGIVEDINYQDIFKLVKEGDLIISRCTAPVVRLCIELIAKRIPAKVRGRDIGKSLTTIVKEVAAHPEFKWKHFNKFLDEYRHLKVAKLQQRRNSESQIQSLCDRIEGIQICYESFDCRSVEDLCREIEALFSDQRSSVVLSSVHRAKGLEENRVFILRPDQLPLIWQNQQTWELQQELNLKYVALTRAKSALYFVQEDQNQKKEKEDDN